MKKRGAIRKGEARFSRWYIAIYIHLCVFGQSAASKFQDGQMTHSSHCSGPLGSGNSVDLELGLDIIGLEEI